MRNLDVAARFLALGSLLLAVFACPATALGAVADVLVIAQADGDLNPSPTPGPSPEAPIERGDEDLETDDSPDPVLQSHPFSARTGASAAQWSTCPTKGERTAKRRALERPPRVDGR